MDGDMYVDESMGFDNVLCVLGGTEKACEATEGTTRGSHNPAGCKA